MASSSLTRVPTARRAANRLSFKPACRTADDFLIPQKSTLAQCAMPIRSETGTTLGEKLDEASLSLVLGFQLARAAIVTTRLFRASAGEPMDLRPVEYTVLTLIAENPGSSLVALARMLAVTAPNISTMVDRLESRKLVVRKSSEEDRRTKVVQVTSKGQTLATRATQRILEAERQHSGLTVGEHRLLLELLHKVHSRGE